MAIREPKPGDYEQLLLDLDLPETELYLDAEQTPEQVRARLEAAAVAFNGQNELPEWYEAYDRLRMAGWSHADAAYIAWAATPRNGRKPGTLKELAVQVCGYTSPRQIHKRRAMNPVIDEAVALMQAEELFEGRADVIDALIRSASTNDYKNKPDRELYFKLRGELVEQSENTSTVRFSADEMAGAREDVEAWRKERFEGQAASGSADKPQAPEEIASPAGFDGAQPAQSRNEVSEGTDGE